MFLVIYKNINFYNEFYVQILCEFSMVLNYDEMNCKIVSGVFYNVLWSVDFGYMQ